MTARDTSAPSETSKPAPDALGRTRPAPADHPVHELVRHRWSTVVFEDRPVPGDVLRSVLEAARWAPSSFNEQPWSYLVARKEDGEAFERMLSTLTEGNRRWAKEAPVLMISLASSVFERNGEANRHAFHDVGQASAQLSLQATALGLSVHQMAGFHPERVRELYGLPDEVEPVAAMALGYPGDPEEASEKRRERELSPRRRDPLPDFVFDGRWGEPADWADGDGG
jgi:nitroreductase